MSPIDITVLIALLVVGYLLVRRLTYSEERSAILRRKPQTMADFLNQMEIGETGLNVLPGWQDCPCCGYPTYNSAAASPICGLCSWEQPADGAGLVDELERARANFVAYGAVYSPEDAAAWEGSVPSDEEREWQRAFMDLCGRVRTGDLEFDEWYARVYELSMQTEFDPFSRESEDA